MKRTCITDAQALALRPETLPGVEPELAVPRPRPMVWTARPWSHGVIRDEDAALLRQGLTARAWTTSVQITRDSEGPDIAATFAYEHAGALLHGRFHGSYDAMHLALGFPDFSAWLGRAFGDGGTLTVLLPQGDPGACRIYGRLELYVSLSLDRALEQGRHDAVGRLLRGPIGPLQGDDWFAYFNGLATLCGIEPDSDTTLFKLMDTALAAIEAGRFDPAPLPQLSAICARYMPGLWAAR